MTIYLFNFLFIVFVLHVSCESSARTPVGHGNGWEEGTVKVMYKLPIITKKIQPHILLQVFYRVPFNFLWDKKLKSPKIWLFFFTYLCNKEKYCNDFLLNCSYSKILINTKNKYQYLLPFFKKSNFIFGEILCFLGF